MEKRERGGRQIEQERAGWGRCRSRQTVTYPVTHHTAICLQAPHASSAHSVTPIVVAVSSETCPRLGRNATPLAACGPSLQLKR